MAEIGKYNTLSINRETENGVYLDGGDLGEILMPQKFVTEEVKDAGSARVFVYTDSEDRLVATTEQPFALVGEFACLTVQEVTKFGAFLDWGLPKNLLVPFREQKSKMVEGNSYVITSYSIHYTKLYEVCYRDIYSVLLRQQPAEIQYRDKHT